MARESVLVKIPPTNMSRGGERKQTYGNGLKKRRGVVCAQLVWANPYSPVGLRGLYDQNK